MFTAQDTILSAGNVTAANFALLIGCVFVAILSSHYLSAVKSDSAVQSSWKPPFHDPKTFIESGYRLRDFDVGAYLMELNTVAEQMRQVDSPDTRYLQRIISSTLLFSAEIYNAEKYSPNHVKDRHHVWHDLIQDRNCSVREVSLTFSPPVAGYSSWPPKNVAVSFPIRNDSELIQAFHSTMRTVTSFGLRKALRRKMHYYWEGEFSASLLRQACRLEHAAKIRTIGYDGVYVAISEVVPAFLLLIGGGISAASVFAAEVLIGKCESWVCSDRTKGRYFRFRGEGMSPYTKRGVLPPCV